MIDFNDPKWRLKERVRNMVRKGLTEKEAEELVKKVIETKEGPHGPQ